MSGLLFVFGTDVGLRQIGVAAETEMTSFRRSVFRLISLDVTRCARHYISEIFVRRCSCTSRYGNSTSL